MECLKPLRPTGRFFMAANFLQRHPILPRWHRKPQKSTHRKASTHYRQREKGEQERSTS